MYFKYSRLELER